MKNLTRTSVALALLAGISLAGCKDNKDNTTQQQAEIHDSVYTAAGDRLVMATFDTLRNSLARAIGTYGVDGAIGFCNTNALPLTNSFADTVVIRRTALRYRNPQNKPDSLEHLILSRMNLEQTPRARIIRASGRVHYFKPIITQGMCLNCHGKPNTDITPSTMASITKLYRQDLAVGFDQGTLRGLWHVIFTMPSGSSGLPRD